MNILQEIYQYKLIEVRNRKKQLSLNDICKSLKCLEKTPEKHQFYLALKNKNDKNQLALICEIKKGSPSAGIISPDLDVAKTAKEYQDNQATCISVLTDEKYFYSHLDFLKIARESCDLPLLRKDFIVDAYQIYEAKLYGANCILLIVAMLDDSKLQDLESTAIELGLDVLIEVHSLDELNRALKLKSPLIGINNRDLKTLKIDLNTAIELKKFVPDDRLIICESGIKSISDLENFRQNNINCFLIGEFFMRGGKIDLH
jgi:indole-3-glycerol phosphate synthase